MMLVRDVTYKQKGHVVHGPLVKVSPIVCKDLKRGLSCLGFLALRYKNQEIATWRVARLGFIERCTLVCGVAPPNTDDDLLVVFPLKSAAVREDGDAPVLSSGSQDMRGLILFPKSPYRKEWSRGWSTSQEPSSQWDSNLPNRLFATDHYPRGRLNVYSRPDILSFIKKVFDGTEELDFILQSCFGPLFHLPVSRVATSGKVIHALLCRQLLTKKKYEFWTVFGGHPMRFSLLEFASVTGLPCGEFPDEYDPEDSPVYDDGKKSYWNELIGQDKTVTLGDISAMLTKKRRKLSSDHKLKLAFLLIVDGVLIASNQTGRPTFKYVEMLADLEKFLSFPWGRESFMKTVEAMTPEKRILAKSTGKRQLTNDPIQNLVKQLQQITFRLKGFPHALQLLAFRNIPGMVDLLKFDDTSLTILHWKNLTHPTQLITLPQIHSLESNLKRPVDPLIGEDINVDQSWAEWDDEEVMLLPSIKIPKEKSSVVHKKHIVDRKKRLRVKSDPPKSKHSYSTRFNQVVRLSDDEKSRLIVDLQNKVEELSNRVMKLEKKRKTVSFKRSRKPAFGFVPLSFRSKRKKSLEVPTQSQASENPSHSHTLSNEQNEDFDIEDDSWDVSPPLSHPSTIVQDDEFKKFQDESIDRTTLTNTVITDDPMDVNHTPHESQDSEKDDATEDNPIYDTGAKDPNDNEPDDEGKIQFDSSANVSNKKQSPLEENNIMEVNLEAGEASQSVVEPQPDDPIEGNAASQCILKDPNGHEADDEGKIQFDSSANLSQKEQSPLEQDNIMEDTLETVEASLSVFETQPEVNIADDPMRGETLETVEASHSVLETQPGENIDDDHMTEVTLESATTSHLVELPQPDDPMEGNAASHSLLETQPEVNIDGDSMKVTLEMPASSHSVSEAQPEEKIGNDPMEHMEVLVSLLSRRLTTTLENHRSSFVDSWFTSHLQAKFRAFNAAKVKSRVCWSEDMQRFIKGSKTEWFKDIDTIYAPMIWNDCHWVGLSINLGIWSVEILDPNTDLYDDAKVKRCIEPVINLLPHLIQRYCTPEFSQNHGLQPFGWSRIDGIYKNLRSGDCGPVAMKFLEIQASDKLPYKMAEITDKHVDAFRRESSMVHGATFLWVESFYMFKFETLLFILFALVSEDLITMKLISFPATMSPSPTSFVAAHPPTNVHLSNLQKETRMIFNGLGPYSHQQNSGPAVYPEKALSHACGRSISPASQSLELLILVTYCVQLSRILFASSSRLWSEELFNTKDSNSTALVSSHVGWDHYYRTKYTNRDMPASTFYDPKQCSSLAKLSLPSFDMERTLFSNFTWFPTCKVSNHPRLLTTSSRFVPATVEVKESFSTSLSHDISIVTTCNLLESFADVPLTHHELACGILLFSLCLRVFMTLSPQLVVYFFV
ncbi:hypothetical protein ISN44_As01g033880 [Arabidopsis suecica]|uniref:Ubiquitin-like protease family profile domain-containing protein n=1 Tax=Arabidopsis suecica TaxID=45249 RepID=A0A8T2HBN7_ARASU|nr:hypothetical protein ISN44_As01g033880 [Arabidopsis suecica]